MLLEILLLQLEKILDDGFNNGVYEAGSTTAQGNTTAENMYAMEFGPGTAYVRGYRVKTLSPTYVDVDETKRYTVNPK